MRERAKGAMRRGMAVAADDRGARKGEALFGADDMDNSLAEVALVEIFDAKFLGIGGELRNLNAAFGIVDAMRAVRRRHIVIDHGERLLRRADTPAAQPQALEGLRARHLMHQVAVDINQTGAIRIRMDEMIVPNLIVKRARRRHAHFPVRRPSRHLQKYNLEWQFLLASGGGGKYPCTPC